MPADARGVRGDRRVVAESVEAVARAAGVP